MAKFSVNMNDKDVGKLPAIKKIASGILLWPFPFPPELEGIGHFLIILMFHFLAFEGTL